VKKKASNPPCSSAAATSSRLSVSRLEYVGAFEKANHAGAVLLMRASGRIKSVARSVPGDNSRTNMVSNGCAPSAPKDRNAAQITRANVIRDIVRSVRHCGFKNDNGPKTDGQ